MARGMEQDQIRQVIVLGVSVPVMPFDLLFDLHHLPTARAEPVLLSQARSTKGRRRTQRHPLVAGTAGGFPVRIERGGLTLDLEVALGLGALPHPEDLFAGGRSGEVPTLPRLVGQVALRAPAPGLVGVAPRGPTEQPPPHQAVEPEKGLAAEGVARVVGPASQDGVEPSEERFRGGPRGLLAEGADLGLEGVEAGRAGFD